MRSAAPAPSAAGRRRAIAIFFINIIQTHHLAARVGHGLATPPRCCMHGSARSMAPSHERRISEPGRGARLAAPGLARSPERPHLCGAGRSASSIFSPIFSSSSTVTSPRARASLTLILAARSARFLRLPLDAFAGTSVGLSRPWQPPPPPGTLVLLLERLARVHPHRALLTPRPIATHGERRARAPTRPRCGRPARACASGDQPPPAAAAFRR